MQPLKTKRTIESRWKISQTIFSKGCKFGRICSIHQWANAMESADIAIVRCHSCGQSLFLSVSIVGFSFLIFRGCFCLGVQFFSAATVLGKFPFGAGIDIRLVIHLIHSLTLISAWTLLMQGQHAIDCKTKPVRISAIISGQNPLTSQKANLDVLWQP